MKTQLTTKDLGAHIAALKAAMEDGATSIEVDDLTGMVVVD